MTQTVKVPGLGAILKWLAPLVKSISGGTVQVADGVVLNLPPDAQFTASETADPDILNIAFPPMNVNIHRRILGGLIPINATEAVNFIDIKPDSLQTQVGPVKVVVVDGAA